MNKIFEEIGKTFGRQIFEMFITHATVTITEHAIIAGIDYYKNKKLIEISQNSDMLLQNGYEEPYCNCSCGCGNEENYEEEDHQSGPPIPTPIVTPNKRGRKKKN